MDNEPSPWPPPVATASVGRGGGQWSRACRVALIGSGIGWGLVGLFALMRLFSGEETELHRQSWWRLPRLCAQRRSDGVGCAGHCVRSCCDGLHPARSRQWLVGATTQRLTVDGVLRRRHPPLSGARIRSAVDLGVAGRSGHSDRPFALRAGAQLDRQHNHGGRTARGALVGGAWPLSVEERGSLTGRRLR